MVQHLAHAPLNDTQILFPFTISHQQCIHKRTFEPTESRIHMQFNLGFHVVRIFFLRGSPAAWPTHIRDLQKQIQKTLHTSRTSLTHNCHCIIGHKGRETVCLREHLLDTSFLSPFQHPGICFWLGFCTGTVEPCCQLKKLFKRPKMELFCLLPPESLKGKDCLHNATDSGWWCPKRFINPGVSLAPSDFRQSARYP